jgi:predicted nucleic acid-binding protein
MSGPSATEAPSGTLGSSTGVYIDSSALAKLYVPEPDSDALDAALEGRTDLWISDLALTEVLSAVARRKREGEMTATHATAVRDALLADAGDGLYGRLDLSRDVHREAERLLLTIESVPLRTLDALHIALARAAGCTHVVTFDRRMATAATQSGLRLFSV